MSATTLRILLTSRLPTWLNYKLKNVSNSLININLKSKSKTIYIYIFIYLNRLSDSLLEKETLDLNDIVAILGERPFEPKDNYKAYITAKEIDNPV